ncbi:MAG: TIR domain-containing protein [Rhodospirillaceae bacterium]
MTKLSFLNSGDINKLLLLYDANPADPRRAFVDFALALGKDLSRDYVAADLRDYPLTGQNLTEVNLTGADLRGADLRGAVGYKQAGVLLEGALQGAPPPDFNIKEFGFPEIEPAHCFISHSHKDKIWLKKLMKHLKRLESIGSISVCDDSGISHDNSWYDDIREAMETARVAVLLISPDYLGSDFCMKEEFPYLVERAEAGGLILLPILVRTCDWEGERWLRETQLKPVGGKPLSKLGSANVDAELKKIILDLQARLDAWTERKPPADAPPPWPSDRCDITRLPASGRELFGRKEELAWLDACWRTPGTNVVSLIGWGGVGKSALVNRWLDGMEKRGWDGAERVFGWSFYSQGSHENCAASADAFIEEALRRFGDPDPPHGSPWDKGERLAELIREQRTLLVLDGLEPLQWAAGDMGRVRDPALALLLEELAADNPGLVLITSRMHVAGLEDYPGKALERDLELLSKGAGRAVLRVRGVRGSDTELEAISAAFGNHALAVSLLASWLRVVDAPHKPAALAIPDLPTVREDVRPIRRVLAAFAERFGECPERQLLRLLGLFDRPATAGELKALLAAPPIPGLTDHLGDDAVRAGALDSLRKINVVAKESPHAPRVLDAHPLVRVHFQEELQARYPAAWREGNNRLFAYLTTLPAKNQPDTLEELRPLYLAIPHGCAAGRHQYVLDMVLGHRIQRGGEYYTTHKLGAFATELAALKPFFAAEPPWRLPLPILSPQARGALLSQAAAFLRALGRLAEAVVSMEAAIEISLEQGNLLYAATSTNILCELLLTLGRLVEAEAAAARAVELIGRSGDALRHIAYRITLADTRHQRGDVSGALAVFVDAEEQQAKERPHHPLLYSLLGFRYCDLLLSRGEAEAARLRAAQALEIAQRNNWLLDIALDHLSIGRAATALHDASAAETHLEAALAGLRRSGRQDYLCHGLLARCAFRRQGGEFDKARRDLDEVLRIAKRGGQDNWMRLFLVDHDLEAARVAMGEGKGDQARWLVAKARNQIAETGYHRRDGEVAELEYATSFSG